MLIAQNHVRQNIDITKKEFEILQKLLKLQEVCDPERQIDIKINSEPVGTISVENNTNDILATIKVVENPVGLDWENRNKITPDLSQILVEYHEPTNYHYFNKKIKATDIGECPISMQLFMTTALSRAESIANVEPVHILPPHSSIVTKFRLLNHRYYLMSYLPKGADGKESLNPRYFVKIKMTVDKLMRQKKAVVTRMYDAEIPDIQPSAYAVFGNIKNPKDGTIHWVSVMPKSGLEEYCGIDIDDISEMWSRINDYSVLPIINLNGAPVTIDSIQSAQSIMSLVLAENQHNPDFDKIESVDDDNAEESLVQSRSKK